MTLRHLTFDQIDQASLQHLITTGAAESRDIEYKQQTYGGNDAERTEFLADISSFANTVGGDLVIGMVENAGVPTGFVPFTSDADTERLRLEAMARDGLEPRINNLQTKTVPLAGGGAVLIIRVPRSYNPPHRIVFQRKNKFFARSSAGKYEPNVDELRALFTLAPQLTDRIREFKIDRIAKIVGGNAPVSLQGNCCFVLHVVPFTAFDIRSQISVPRIAEHPNFFPPLATDHPADWHSNFDGFLSLSNAVGPNNLVRAYTQVFRSGIVEAVTSTIDRGENRIFSVTLEAAIVKYSRIYMAGVQSLGGSSPFVVLVSLLGMAGKFIVCTTDNGRLFVDPVPPVGSDQLHFNEVVFDNVPNDNQACATVARPILDQIANAGGQPSTNTFDAAGNYLPPIR